MYVLCHLKKLLGLAIIKIVGEIYYNFFNYLIFLFFFLKWWFFFFFLLCYRNPFLGTYIHIFNLILSFLFLLLFLLYWHKFLLLSKSYNYLIFYCSFISLFIYYAHSHLCPSIPVLCLVAQSCLTLGDPVDCSLPGSSVHGILQTTILEWVAGCSLLQGIFPTQGLNLPK